MRTEIKFGKWVLRVELARGVESEKEAARVESPKVVEAVPAEIGDNWFIELNNTYLRIERAGRAISRANGNRLVELVNLVYPFAKEPTMHEYWLGELESLPGWGRW